MRRTCFKLTCFLALLVCLASVNAQTRDKYVISVKAGGINFITGDVTIERGGKALQQPVTDQDNLENGDVLTTGLSGRVEVLLNPGSYLRIAENSAFEMTDTSLQHLRIKLLRGSAIIEAVGTDDTELSIQVDTPDTSAVVLKRGIYRFNVLRGGGTEVLVRKGRALVGPMALVVKSGKMVTVTRSGNMSEVAKIGKREKDALELWSHDRAEYLASINRSMAPTIVNIGVDIWASYNDRYGAWAYDDRRRCYVYMPGRGGASSPYGYGYDNCRCGGGGGRRNDTPGNVPPPSQPGGVGAPVADGTPPTDAAPVAPPTDEGPRRDREPGGSFRPGRPNDENRPVGESPSPVNRPDSPAPVSRPEPEPAPVQSAPAQSAPSYSPPPEPSSPPPSPPPSQEPVRTEAPMPSRSENPND